MTAAALAVLLAVTALPAAVMAEEKDDKKQLTKVTLNEVAHSIFYAPQYVAIEKGYFADQGLDVELVTGFGADKVLTALISGYWIYGSGGLYLRVSGGSHRSGSELCPADSACRKFPGGKRRDDGFSVE